MKVSRIRATGHYLPVRSVTNEELMQSVETTAEWIESRTGIQSRHIASSEETTSSMAIAAGQSALSLANLKPEDIDLVIVATTTPDMVFPSTACLVQQGLGIPTGAAFDVQAVCAGFMYALTTAHAYLQAGLATRALIIGSEKLSNIVNWQDRNTCVLFGDGAGAVILESVPADSVPESGIIHAKLAADGRQQHLLKVPAHFERGALSGSPYIEMDGPGVFKFAVQALSSIASSTLKEAGVSPSEVDWLIPHQANVRIIESTAKHLNLSMDKVVLTLATHGNTSAASIPLALDVAIRRGQVQRGQVLLLEGIGGGFAWGAILLRY